MSAARKSDLVDIDVYVRHETDAAYLVVTEEKQKKGVWVPKSLGEVEPKGKAFVLTVPEWFASQNGLV
jgi:hypothetical protein